MSRGARSRLRLATTIALSYLLSVFLLAFISGMIFLQTALSPAYMEGRMDETGFTGEIYAEVREIFLSYASASGIPHEVMLQGLTHRHVDDAVKSNMMHAFSAGVPYDYARHEGELFEILVGYALSQGSAPSEELDGGLRDLAALSMGAFSSHTEFGIIGLVAETITRYRQPLTVAVAAAAGLSVLAAALLPLINKRVTRWLDAYMYALGAAAIYCVAIPALALGTGWTQRLNIVPPSFNRLVSAWLEGIAGGFTVALVPVLALMAACLAVRIARKSRRRGG